MAKRIIFQDNVVQYPNRYSITDLGSGLYELQSSPGTVTSEGTAITASILNSISDEIIFKLKDTSTSTTAYTAALDGISSYYESLTVLFKPTNTNTAAATININGVGAANIKKIDNSGNKVNLVANDLIKNKYSTMTYDGTDFIMNNPSADLAQVITDIQSIENRLDTDESSINTLKNQAVRFATATGSSNAYGVSLSDVTDYYTNLIINFVPNFDNTGACTLQVNSLTAKAIKFNGSDLSAGDLKANKLYTLIYNGVNFELQPSANQIASHLADNTKQIPHLGTTTNSGDTYSITTTETINANQKFTIKFNAASSSTPTLKINIGSSYPIKKANGNNAKLYASVYTLFFDGSAFILLGEGGEYGTATASDVRSTKTIGTENGVVQGTLDLSQLTPTNIKKGTTIDGKTGTLIPALFTAGDTEFFNASAQVDSRKNYYVEVKRLRFNVGGKIRIKFGMVCMGGTAYAMLYVNGVQTGIERVSTTSDKITYTQDVDINAGDAISLYAKNSNSTDTYIYDFKAYIADTLPIVTLEYSGSAM